MKDVVDFMGNVNEFDNLFYLDCPTDESLQEDSREIQYRIDYELSTIQHESMPLFVGITKRRTLNE